MRGDRLALAARAARKQIAQAAGERCGIPCVNVVPVRGGALASEGAGLGIGQALLLRACQGRLFHQHPLPLIPLAGPTEPYDDRPQRRVRAGSSSERRATTRQKDEMIEIRTAETEWSAILHSETLPLQELRLAFLARRISDDRKDDDLRSLCGGLRGFYHREAA